MTRAGVGDRAFALDTAVIGVVSVAICLAASRLWLMTGVVTVVWIARLALWARLPPSERGHPLTTELGFLLLCTVVGAFNDWSSVTRHQIYSYTVPLDLPALSGIPTWMLVYWGLILRFVTTLFSWRRLGLPAPRARGRALRLGFLLAIVVATRQLIYRTYGDSVWSWVPFAVALVLVLTLLFPGRKRALLMGVFLLGGPLVEIAYISIGGLHSYALGWFFGVPLWIVLWWPIAALVWDEVGYSLTRWSWRSSSSG